MGKMFKVSSQGIGNDFSSANGDYETIEHGDLTSDSLYEVIQKFKAINEIIPEGNEDICPPSLYIEHEGKDYSFYLSGGEIVNLNTETKLSPMETVNLVSGFTTKKEVAEEALQEMQSEPARSDQGSKPKHSPLAWGSDHAEIKGMTPVRKKDLPPTDKEEWSGFNMDTKNSPQISVEVYKSDLSKGLPVVILIFGILFILMSLALLTSDDSKGIGVVFILIGIIFIWFRSVVKKWVRTEFNLGFDWKANAMWSKRKTDKQAIMVGNANCIKELTLTKSTSKRQNHRDYSDSAMERAAKNAQTDTKWILEAVMSNGAKRHAFDFYAKKEAEEVFNKAQVLLTQQN